MPPTTRNPLEQRATSAALGPSQRALEVISLHLPAILGARAVSPSSLLTPSTAPAPTVSPESAVLQSAIRALHQGGSFSAPAEGVGDVGPRPDLGRSVDDFVTALTSTPMPHIGLGGGGDTDPLGQGDPSMGAGDVSGVSTMDLIRRAMPRGGPR